MILNNCIVYTTQIYLFVLSSGTALFRAYSVISFLDDLQCCELSEVSTLVENDRFRWSFLFCYYPTRPELAAPTGWSHLCFLAPTHLFICLFICSGLSREINRMFHHSYVEGDVSEIKSFAHGNNLHTTKFLVARNFHNRTWNYKMLRVYTRRFGR